nr:hypothetical protein [Mixta theicola]
MSWIGQIHGNILKQLLLLEVWLLSVVGGSTTSTTEKTETDNTKIPAIEPEFFVVENNLLGGNEWTQGEKARQHGADVLSCADNPSGEACQRGLAENKAYAGALATGGVALLPGAAQAMWGVGRRGKRRCSVC